MADSAAITSFDSRLVNCNTFSSSSGFGVFNTDRYISPTSASNIHSLFKMVPSQIFLFQSTLLQKKSVAPESTGNSRQSLNHPGMSSNRDGAPVMTGGVITSTVIETLPQRCLHPSWLEPTRSLQFSQPHIRSSRSRFAEASSNLLCNGIICIPLTLCLFPQKLTSRKQIPLFQGSFPSLTFGWCLRTAWSKFCGWQIDRQAI